MGFLEDLGRSGAAQDVNTYVSNLGKQRINEQEAADTRLVRMEEYKKAQITNRMLEHEEKKRKEQDAKDNAIKDLSVSPFFRALPDDASRSAFWEGALKHGVIDERGSGRNKDLMDFLGKVESDPELFEGVAGPAVAARKNRVESLYQSLDSEKKALEDATLLKGASINEGKIEKAQANISAIQKAIQEETARYTDANNRYVSHLNILKGGKQERFTLSPGQKMVDATGKEIASVAPKEVTDNRATKAIDIPLGGGLFQKTQFNPETGKYDILLGKPFNAKDSSKTGAGKDFVVIRTDKGYAVVDKVQKTVTDLGANFPLPTETVKELSTYESLIETANSIKKFSSEKGEQYIGPLRGNYNKIASTMVDNPDFITLDQNIGFLLETAYALSGKQISDKEMNTLKSKFWADVVNPKGNFDAKMDGYLTWLTRRVGIQKEFLEKSGYGVPTRDKPGTSKEMTYNPATGEFE